MKLDKIDVGLVKIRLRVKEMSHQIYFIDIGKQSLGGHIFFGINSWLKNTDVTGYHPLQSQG